MQVTGELTFVLVHGSRHGGWCWQRVARLLRAKGHEVHCPTLSGGGDRSHLAPAGAINLDTHVRDVGALLFFEDLSEVVLVGHSYGGMVITGVAECCERRIARLVYFDALVPRAGESHLDLARPEVARELRSTFVGRGTGRCLPGRAASPERYGVTDPGDAAWMRPRFTDQPVATYEQRLASDGSARRLARIYIHCQRSDMISDVVIDRVRRDRAIEFVEIPAVHDAMITDPELVADTLLQSATAVN